MSGRAVSGHATKRGSGHRLAGAFAAGGLIVLSACATDAPRETTTASASVTPTKCRSGEPFTFGFGRGLAWRVRPDVVVLARGGDYRVTLVKASVAYWNRHFEAIGSGFRLGAVTVERLPYRMESYMPRVSRTVLRRQRGLPSREPEGLGRHCGRIVVVLAGDQFISFAKIVRRHGFLLVGIKGDTHFPFDRPNVARNVIAHEIGHAIGLRHNADPAMLMCGRPAPCRPTAFESSTSRFFPITEGEKKGLRAKYPPNWPGPQRPGS